MNFVTEVESKLVKNIVQMMLKSQKLIIKHHSIKTKKSMMAKNMNYNIVNLMRMNKIMNNNLQKVSLSLNARKKAKKRSFLIKNLKKKDGKVKVMNTPMI